VSQAKYEGMALSHRSIIVFISRKEVHHRHTPSGELMVTKLPPQHNSRKERKAKRRQRYVLRRFRDHLSEESEWE
jgi:hypothetical protein